MRKQTDLDEVERTAITLLHTDIYETPYSPMIVKHPFADTGVTAIPDSNGGIQMINLMEEDAQNRWRRTMAQSISTATKDSLYTKRRHGRFLRFTSQSEVPPGDTSFFSLADSRFLVAFLEINENDIALALYAKASFLVSTLWDINIFNASSLARSSALLAALTRATS